MYQALAAGITATGALATSWINHIQQKKRYERQLRDERKNWYMQNAYNSPSAQMERLKQAGLNPNLVYQNGGAVQPSGEMSTPNFDYTPIDGSQIVTSAYQSSQASAAIDNMIANTEKTNAETADIVNSNRLKYTPLGKLKEFTLLDDSTKDYYANLFSIPVNSLGQMSIQGALSFQSLREKFHNNRNLELTAELIFNNKNKAYQDAALARLQWYLDYMNLHTEAKKRGWSLTRDNRLSRQDNLPDAFNSLSQTDVDNVFEQFNRELKEITYQSSDFKHFLDGFNQTLGNLPSLINAFKKGDWSNKYKKNVY